MLTATRQTRTATLDRVFLPLGSVDAREPALQGRNVTPRTTLPDFRVACKDLWDMSSEEIAAMIGG